MSIYML